MTWLINDSVEICDSSQRVYTPEGFLVAPALIARTGIQMYRGNELGDAQYIKENNLDAQKIYAVYRPSDEVFKPSFLADIKGKTVVNIKKVKGSVHQSGTDESQVTAKNWKKTSVGEILEEGKKVNENWVSTKIIIRDAEAISDVERGKSQVSMGYSSNLEWTSGEYNGVKYDVIQRNLTPNHLAIVDMARAGRQARIADSDLQQEEIIMTTRTILVDGLQVETTDAGAVAIEKLQKQLADAAKFMDEMDSKMKDSKKNLDDAGAKISQLEEALKKHNEEGEKIKAALAEAKKSSMTADEMDAKVAKRAEVVEKGKKMADSVEYKGKSDDAYQRDVISAVIADSAMKTLCDAITGGAEIKEVDASLVNSAFNALFVSKSNKDSANNKSNLGDAFAGAEKSDGKNGNELKDYRQEYINKQAGA